MAWNKSGNIKGPPGDRGPLVTTIASSATPSVDCTAYTMLTVTALAVNITGFTVTGTPVEGQKLLVRIKDNGVTRTITWGGSFLSSGAAALPVNTVVSKTHLVGLIYDAVALKWVCAASDLAGY